MERDVSAHSSLSSRSANTLLAARSSQDTAATPPTSVEDAASTASDAPKPSLDASARRSIRSRHSVSSYNLNVLAGTAKHGRGRAGTVTPATSFRTVSGDTLVDGMMDTPNRQLVGESVKALDLDWQVDAIPGDVVGPDRLEMVRRRRSTRLELVARVAANAIAETTSSLGKRGRSVMESGKAKLQDLAGGRREGLRARDVAAPGPDDAGDEQRAEKRRRLSPSVANSSTPCEEVKAVERPRPKIKRWLSAGLYIGQERDFNPKLTETKNKMRKALQASPNLVPQNSVLPLPMFAGERLLKQGREFRLPFDVFSPLPGRQPKPDEWRKVSMNRFVGDAANVWKKANPLPSSKCVCTPETGCDEQCQNRFMFYECDDSNCNVGSEHCSNRAFADLKDRCKSGNKYDIGVEVMLTANRGHGIRANRCFGPHQIIVEYAGEIITQEECERRMKHEYKKNESYYLMTFHRGMIIDATRGSIARFVNHSCEPNCKMVKWTVAGKPRMALFAGEKGIMTGEELTYDYNFDPFSQKNVQECRCGMPSCRGVLGPKTSERPKPRPNEGVITGAKRKLQQAFDDSATQAEEALSRKKRKAVSIAKTAINRAKAKLTSKSADATAPVNGPTAEDRAERAARRASSSTTTLLSARDRRVSNRRSTSSLVATISPRRPARRSGSTLQRLASVLKEHPTVARATSKLSRPHRSLLTSTPGASKAHPFEPISPVSDRADATAEMLEDLRPVAGRSGKDSTKARPQASSALRNAAASVRKNVVRSVRGPRRAAAMARMGLMADGIESGSTIKVILSD